MSPARFANWLRRRLPGALGASVLLGLAAGCAYGLGPTNQQVAGAQTVSVGYFPNETLQPGLTDVVTSAVRKQVLRDGTFRLSTRGDADLMITGRIIQYSRLPLGSRRDDVITPQDYDISITVRVKATRGVQTVFEGDVTGRALVITSADLNVSERENIPVAAERLAQNLVNAVANGSW